MTSMKFSPGQRVRKKGGYPFPGIIEAAFTATQIDGTTVDRYVVNQTVVMHAGIGPSGLLHIFAPEQLVAIDEEEHVGPHVADDTDGAAAKLVAEFEEAVRQHRHVGADRLRGELIAGLERRK